MEACNKDYHYYYNYYGRLLSVPEDLLTTLEHLLTFPEYF